MEKKKHKKLSIIKKIFFSLIVLILFLLAIEILSYTALSYLCVPIPRKPGGNAYMMTSDPDLGWTLAPGASHHIDDDRKGYDFTVRIGNGFRKDNQDIGSVRECDIITIGDSHTFGFGTKEDQTLAFQLHRLLSDDEHKCLVFNGGVPGYGLDQYYLRLRSLGHLKKDSLVIVYVNPINDIVNLSRDIDYGSTRLYARLAENGVEYIKPTLYDPETSFHFSPDFDSLNQAFNVSTPTPPPANIPIFHKSQTYRFFSGLLDKRFRFRWNQIEPTEAIYSYLEGWELEQRRNTDVQRNLLRYAAEKWMEISEFDSERHVAEELIFGILCDMKKHVNSQQGRLLIVIAEEAYGKQGFFIRYEEILKQQLPQYTFEEGWSRQAIRHAAEKANIDFLIIDYPADRIDSMFISYDGHTSADGFSFVAQRMVAWIDKQQFTFLDGKTFSDFFIKEDKDINNLDGNGYTRLHYAVQNGNYQTVEQLISEGADINLKDRWSETALFIAAARGHKSILQMLIDKGADINAVDHRNQSPLHQAVSNGHKDIVELLITNDVDVNAENKAGQTPLDLAKENNHIEIVELLKQHGAKE